MTDTLTLTRFEPRDTYHNVDRKHHRLGAFVDTETTGLDPAVDEIIQVGMIRFTYSDDGEVGTVGVPLVELEEPSVRIPESIIRLTGITDEVVRGKRIDTARVIRELQGVDIVIAHHAAFDRPFLEKRVPAFASRRWGCSRADVPWRTIYTSDKLEWLLFKHCRMFYDAHEADLDCAVGIHLLSTEVGGKFALRYLIEAAEKTWFRVYAFGSPFDSKNALRARGYRWDAEQRVWWTDVEAADDELAWLEANVPCRPRMKAFNAYARFSRRIDGEGTA